MKIKIVLDIDDTDRLAIGRGEKASRHHVKQWAEYLIGFTLTDLRAELDPDFTTELRLPPLPAEEERLTRRSYPQR